MPFIVQIFNNTQLKHQIDLQIQIGSSLSEAQSTMSSIGFLCTRYSSKAIDAPVDELFCLKKDAIGPGLTNDFWRFVIAIAPSLYAAVPKNQAASSTYQRQEIEFVLDSDVVRSIRASSRLTPQ